MVFFFVVVERSLEEAEVSVGEPHLVDVLGHLADELRTTLNDHPRQLILDESSLWWGVVSPESELVASGRRPSVKLVRIFRTSDVAIFHGLVTVQGSFVFSIVGDLRQFDPCRVRRTLFSAKLTALKKSSYPCKVTCAILFPF